MKSVTFTFFRTLTKTEQRALAITVFLQALVISLPYLWALAITPEGFVYSGLLYNPDDQNVHLAWMRQAAEGKLFFNNLFTTESLLAGERPLFTNLFYWFAGALSALTKLPLVWTYHLFRVLLAAVTLLIFYALCARFTNDVRTRIIALLFAAFAGGGGFLAPLLPQVSWLDRADNPGAPMMPEAFTFASSYIFTLNIVSMALLLGVYLLAIFNWETGSKRAAAGAGICAFFLTNFHTYDIFPLLLTLAVWAVFSWKSTLGKSTLHESTFTQNTSTQSTFSASQRLRRFTFAPSVLVGAAIPIFYQLLVFRGSEEFRVKALTKTVAPPLADVLLSYSPLLLLAFFGGALAWRSVKTRLPILWVLATLACIYIPVSFARKMIEGLHLPLCFLAALGAVSLLSKLQASWQRNIATAGVLLVTTFTSFQFVVWSLENAQDNNASRAHVLMPPLYLTDGDASALQYLEAQPRGKIVLSLPFVGNYLPRESGQTSYIGHWAETLHFQQKLGKVLGFYTGKMSADEAREWLQENQIDYVILGSYETQLGAALPFELPLSHSEKGTAVYAVPK